MTLVFLALVGSAIAGPKELVYTGPVSYVPVTAGTMDQLASGPQCVEVDTRGMPTLDSCPPALEPLYDRGACGEFLCEDALRPSPLPPQWGLFSFSPASIGAAGDTNYLAVDHVYTKETAYAWVDPTGLDDRTLDGLAETCMEPGARQLVMEVHVGCGKTLRQTDWSPMDGPVKLRNGFELTPERGEGVFLTDKKGPDVSECTGEEVVVAVTTHALAEVCSEVVFPESTRRLRDALAEFTAEPDVAQDTRIELLVGLDRVQVGREDLLRNIETTRKRLSEGRTSLGATRTEIEELGGADDRKFIGLLTELERLSSEISETFVSLSSLEERAEALADEGKALQDKADLETDGLATRYLQQETDALTEDGRALVGEFRGERDGVDAILRDIGFLQGRVAQVRGDE
jgi:predicted  nucleic acid-binding Zn-ribbon protein